MRLFILSLSEFFQVIFFIGMTIFFAFVSAFICSLFFDAHQLETNIGLISSIYQVMGTIYAILLTFTLWGVWQNFTEANRSVQNEAYSLIDLVHILEASATWKNKNIRDVALTYSKQVVEREWSMLKQLTSTTINLNEFKHSCMEVVIAVQNITPTNQKDTALYEQALTLLNNWLNARRSRMLIARGNSTKALWPLLLIGALVLFSFHGLFVTQTIGIWSMLLFGISLVIGLTFYLIFTLDCPFEGSLAIDSEPFELAINILKSRT